MKIIGIAILVVAGFLGLTWVFQGNDFFLYQYFAPKQEAVRRQVFENTPSFNKGMVQELENMEFDYNKTTDKNAKQALAAIILHRASGYNLNDNDVPQDLRMFISQLKENQ